MPHLERGAVGVCAIIGLRNGSSNTSTPTALPGADKHTRPNPNLARESSRVKRRAESPLLRSSTSSLPNSNPVLVGTGLVVHRNMNRILGLLTNPPRERSAGSAGRACTLVLLNPHLRSRYSREWVRSRREEASPV